MNNHGYNIDELLNAPTTTKRQKVMLEALKENHTMPKTAKALGINKRTLQNTLSRCNKKYLADSIDHLVPDGLALKGTTDHYKLNEDTGQMYKDHFYIKTDKDKEAQYQAMRDATIELAKSVEGKGGKTTPPSAEFNDLLVVYVNTDLHLGQYSWSQETGKDVNLDIVHNNTVKAIQMLSQTTPNASECIVLDLGDTLHAANDDARTKSGHVLDTDTRHAKVFKTLIDMKIKMIDLALKKHQKVKYSIVAGNHSELVPHYVTAMLDSWYRDEPRFSVDDSPALHKYHRHGEVLLGFHHGHATKMGRLPEVMVWDRKEDISSTTYRYWLTGHLHKDTLLDNPISRVESFRNATGNDSWAAGAGFRGHKQSVAVTYHKTYGEIARNVCPIPMVEETNSLDL